MHRFRPNHQRAAHRSKVSVGQLCLPALRGGQTPMTPCPPPTTLGEVQTVPQLANQATAGLLYTGPFTVRK